MKYTQNVPDELMAALREEHAYTYAQHHLKLSPWICAILEAWLKSPSETHLPTCGCLDCVCVRIAARSASTPRRVAS